MEPNRHPRVDAEEVLNACRGLGSAMEGIEMGTLDESERLANRGW